MKKILHSILNTGIEADTDYFSAFIIYSINFIAIFGVLAAIASVSIVDTNRPKFVLAYIVIACVILLFLSMLFFNAKKRYGLAKFCLFGLFPLVQFYNIMNGNQAHYGVELTILPLILATTLAVNRMGLRIITLCYLIFICFYPLRLEIYNLGTGFIFNLVIIISVTIISFHIVLNHFKKYAENISAQNEKLSQQNIKLQHLIEQNEHKNDLLAMLSHDLKGPASSFNDLAKKVAFLIKKERFDELEDFGEYFEVAGDKIFKNIDRLLSWSISQKNEIITQMDTISPYALINEISQRVELLNPTKNIYFDNLIPENLLISTDVRILEIIVHNLLSNALNNSPNEESIVIKSESSQPKFVFALTNQGPQIDMNIVELAKAGKFQKSKIGHGLGIGICFSLIKFLKGEINYESCSRNGTTVKISIPIGEAQLN